MQTPITVSCQSEGLTSVILFSQIWDLQNSILFSWAAGLGKNVHVIFQTVRTCMQIPCTHEAPFQLSSVPQRQLSASARHSGTQSWRHGSGYGIQADPQHRAPTRRRACMQEHRTLPRLLSLPGLIVMTFQRLSSRRRLQSLRPSETFQRLVRHETSICRVLQIPSRPRCHGVTLVRKLRFTALYWSWNGVSIQNWRRPEASTDDHPSTQKLLYL